MKNVLCSRFRAWVRCALFVLLASVAPTEAAPVGAVAEEEKPDASGWRTIPASILSSRLVRPTAAPATVYRVIIDATVKRDPKLRVAQSSGNDAVDGIAWDYTKIALRRIRAQPDSRDGRELRFQLRLTPAALDVAHMEMPADLSSGPASGYRPPAPPYPAFASRSRLQGHCQLQIKFPAAGGRPLQVALLESTGDNRLDAYIVQWSLLTWRGPKGAKDDTKIVPVTFRLVRR